MNWSDDVRAWSGHPAYQRRQNTTVAAHPGLKEFRDYCIDVARQSCDDLAQDVLNLVTWTKRSHVKICGDWCNEESSGNEAELLLQSALKIATERDLSIQLE
jgi:hypothetical protein